MAFSKSESSTKPANFASMANLTFDYFDSNIIAWTTDEARNKLKSLFQYKTWLEAELQMLRNVNSAEMPMEVEMETSTSPEPIAINAEEEIRENLEETLQNPTSLQSEDLQNNNRRSLRNRTKIGNNLSECLISASMQRDLLAIKELLQMGADPFITNVSGQNFLHLLLDDTTLSPEIFHDLIQTLIDLDKGYEKIFETRSDNKVGQTPLQTAVGKGQIISEESWALLQAKMVDFNITDKFGNGLAYHAIRGNQSGEMLENLVKMGVKINQSDEVKGGNLLSAAAFFGNFKVLKSLIKLGLDVNWADYEGNTPVHVAVGWGKKNKFEMVKTLGGNGADLGRRNMKGETPLEMALKMEENPRFGCYAKGNEKIIGEIKKIVKFLQENDNDA